MNTHVFPGANPSTRGTTSLEGFAARTPPAQPVGFGALLAALVGLVIKPAGGNPEAAATAGGETGGPGAETASTDEGAGNGATGDATTADGHEVGNGAGTGAAGKVAHLVNPAAAAPHAVPTVTASANSTDAGDHADTATAQGTDGTALCGTTRVAAKSPADANRTGNGDGPAPANGAGSAAGPAAAENALSTEGAAAANGTAPADGTVAAGLEGNATGLSADPPCANGGPAHSSEARRRTHAPDAKDGARVELATGNAPMPAAIPTPQQPGPAPAGAKDPNAADEGGPAPEKGRTARSGGRVPSWNHEGDGPSARQPGSPARQSAGTPARGVAARVPDGGTAGNGTMADIRSDGRALHAASQGVTSSSAAVASSVDAPQTQNSLANRPGVHSVAHDGAPAPRPHPTQGGAGRAGAYAAAQATANGTQDGNDAGADTPSRDRRRSDGGEGGRVETSQSRGADAPALGATRTGFRSSVQGPSTPGRMDGNLSMQAHHVARIAHVQDAQAARPPHQVILHVEDADGVTSRVKVALRGVRVGTQIDTAVAAAGELRARTGELRRALDRHGLRADGVQIRSVTSDPAPAVVNDRHTGAAGGHAQGRDEGRAQSHGRPDGQRRHQDQRPGEGRDQKEAS